MRTLTNTYYLIFMVILFQINYTDAAKIEIYTCNITGEIENKIQAKKRKYVNKPIKIILDRENNWFNDLNKYKWLKKESVSENDIEYDMYEDNFKITFQLKKFLNNTKTIDLVIKLTFNKSKKSISFIKYYFDFDRKIILETEVKGICHL